MSPNDAPSPEEESRGVGPGRVRAELLKRVSHELRTPLNTVIGTLELLLRSELSPPQREYGEQARSAANQLMALLADFLDASEMESDKLELRSEGFSLANLLGEVLGIGSSRAQEKGLEVLCDVAEGVPDGVTGDAPRLRRVLTALIDNALKFTDKGTIAVRVAPADPEDPGLLRFSVCDTGVGISPQDQARIFEGFSQADGSTTRRFGGAGLGLAICARLVALMGGRIWVESTPALGSTFHFLARLPEDASSAALPGEGDALPSGLRVLVVDPSPAALRLILDVLSSWGVEGVGIPEPQLALDALRRGARSGTPFALVILDPFMAGAVVFRAQRAGDDPVISATPQLHVLSPGKSAERRPGSSPSVLKPVTRWELRAAMRRALSPTGGAAAAGRLQRPLSPPGPRLRLLVVEDNSVNAFVIARMLELLGHTVEVVGSGPKGVEAAAAGSFDLILMDIQMPEMDGFEAARRIREQELARGIRVPIVALTADATDGEGPFVAAGMEGHLTKPVGLQALRQGIDRALARGVSAAAPSTPPVIDRSQLLARLGGDPDAVTEVLRRFVGEEPATVQALRRTLAARDAPGIVRLTHQLKGTLRWIAADGAAEAAAHLEALAGAADLDRCAEALALLERELGRAADDIRKNPSPPREAGPPDRT